jgi:hypothetical protein
MCCKLFIIPEVNKSVNQWCQHCRPGKNGCTIYDSRPDVCKTFECEWKQQKSELGDEWFPARCKMVLVGRSECLLVLVDSAYPAAWRKEPYHSQLLEWSWEHRIIVQVRGARTVISLRKGIEQSKDYDLAKENEDARKRFRETGSSAP